MTKGKDHPPGGDDFLFWRGEVQGAQLPAGS